MGIYDRDYYRDERGGPGLGLPHTAVIQLVLANVLIWLADGVVFNGWLGRHLCVTPHTLTQPWEWWKFITYGFLHSAHPEHVLLNMFGLWMFGRDVEAVYGRREFFSLYLMLLVAGSVTWCVANRFLGTSLNSSLVGASAGVVGIVLLYILHYPHRTLLFMFVLPVPAWLVGVGMIGYDVYGAMVDRGDNVACGAHLAGAALAFAYFQGKWNFTNLLGRLTGPFGRIGRPRLRVHQPPPDETAEPAELTQEVDRILEKIHREGEASLTRQERQILENASRQYQRRRQAGNP
jgi:membrane associated rhomboid family serine protease